MARSKRQQFLEDTRPIRACLKGWAFYDLPRRRAQVVRAKSLIPALPEYARQWAVDEIAAVEAHCNPQSE